MNPARATHPRSALVLGGGLAGIAAAVRLHESGVDVTLIEARNRLGGRATSFLDPKSNRMIDNCQHVLLRCCTNLIDLYKRLGVFDKIQWQDQLYFSSSSSSRVDVLKASFLPAPLHLALSMGQFRVYSLMEKLSLARAMLGIAAADRSRERQRTFLDWLQRFGQSDALIRRFWDVIVTSTCNLPSAEVSAEAALQVFQEGFLANRDGWNMGLASCPLIELYRPAEAFVGELILGARITNVRSTENIESVLLADGRELCADTYICALPYSQLQGVFAPEAVGRDKRLRLPNALIGSPILGVHLWFDRPVTDLPHLALVEGKAQWLFMKEGGRYVHAVVSAAADWMSLSASAIVEIVLADVRAIFPGAGAAHLEESRVIKERQATFAATPASDRGRPRATGVIPNLFLAGDYCASGWPATMEGAVRSGYQAAAAAVGRGDADTVADLPSARLYRFMGRLSRMIS